MGREQRVNARKKKIERPSGRIAELEKEVAQGNANIVRLEKEINRITLSVAMRRGAILELQRNKKNDRNNSKED